MRRRTVLILLGSAILVSGAAYVSQTACFAPHTAEIAAVSLAAPTTSSEIVCSGRVEATDGELDICAQIAGQLLEVRVTDGEFIRRGHVLAVMEANRELAALDTAKVALSLARAKLARVRAGFGSEEIEEAAAALASSESLLDYAQRRLARIRSLRSENSVSVDELEESTSRVEHLRQQCHSLRKRYEAVRRGPLPEEIALAEAEVAEAEKKLAQANVNAEYRFVRAPDDGTILQVCRHAGDSVSLDVPAPVVRMANVGKLRIRLEVDELDQACLHPDMEGVFRLRGLLDDAGQLKTRTIIPTFGPKRLFDPDTTARVDTRTLAVLCEITSHAVPLYPGQRITAYLKRPSAKSTAKAACLSEKLNP